MRKKPGPKSKKQRMEEAAAAAAAAAAGTPHDGGALPPAGDAHAGQHVSFDMGGTEQI